MCLRIPYFCFEKKINEQKLRLVSVYKADEIKEIQIITNNLGYTARTLADLYKKKMGYRAFYQGY